MSLTGWTIATPAAPWSVIFRDDNLVASGFRELDELSELLLEGEQVAPTSPTGPIADAMTAYLAGNLQALDDVHAPQPGGEFFQSAWAAMTQIRAGETWSYAELSTKAGNPEAVRAAGTACGRNRLAPFVPCHRVVRSDGSLGGYGYGLPVKKWLLAHEQHADVLI
jgi:methylated-DNA-[protein]-cysteine S-methyltransferase